MPNVILICMLLKTLYLTISVAEPFLVGPDFWPGFRSRPVFWWLRLGEFFFLESAPAFENIVFLNTFFDVKLVYGI